MALIRPQLDNFKVFDARKDNIIRYSVQGGEQVGGYILEVYKNSDNTLAYTKKAITFITDIEIPATTLLNGVEYKVRVKTVNTSVLPDFSNMDTNNSSSYSDYMVLRCYSEPSITIPNIPFDDTGNKTIKNQNFTFEGKYQQSEGVQLKSYRYLLYDKEQVLIESFSAVYQLSGVLLQDISGMKNDSEYFIELYVIDQYDQEFSSGLIGFRVNFILPRIRQVLKLENDYKNALIKVEAKIVQVILKATNHTFEDDNWINVENGKVWIDDNGDFKIESDFTCKIYCKELKEKQIWMTMKNRDGYIDIILINNRMHVYKGLLNSSVVSHYASNEIENYNANDTLLVFVQQVNGRINVIAEMVGDVGE